MMFVAGVDAGRAGDAFVLQAITDIDTGRANLYADIAVDAVAEANRCRLDPATSRTPLFTAFRMIGNDQSIGVEHGALEARVWAHVLAYLLAHEAGIAIGGKTVKQDPEGFPGTEAQAQQFGGELVDGREVGDKGKAGPQREGDPDRMLQRLGAYLGGAGGGFVEFHALVVVAFDLAFHPQVSFGPHGLRAGVAAPHTTEQCGEEKQCQTGEDQQCGQVDKVLRPQGQAEQVKLARRQSRTGLPGDHPTATGV